MSRAGTRERPSRAQLEHEVGVFRGLGFNVSAAARQLGLARQTLQGHLRFAELDGLLSSDEREEASIPCREAYIDAKARKLKDFQAAKTKGNWRKPVLIHMPEGPFRLKVFGDPHLDGRGTDFELFEKHWLDMDVEKRCFGLCVGDFFDNWTRALSHLWKESGDPEDAWLLFEALMREKGEGLLAACSGNHDDWTHAPYDPIDMLMKQCGVRYRIGAIRLMLQFPESEPIMVSMRHKWQGNSMYSAAHGLRRGAAHGWNDLIMIGGHIHQDERRMYTTPEGKHSHLCQVSSFKKFDLYPDVHGFMGASFCPVWDLVVDPRLPDTDPNKVMVFWDDIDRAQAYLEAIS